MIAMSTIIAVVTATIMQLKMNTGNQKLIHELYQKIESDPNYPEIPSTPRTNELVDSEHMINIVEESNPSKLVKLLDHLFIMNTCILDDNCLSYKTILSKCNKNQFPNIVSFNYPTTINCTF